MASLTSVPAATKTRILSEKEPFIADSWSCIVNSLFKTFFEVVLAWRPSNFEIVRALGFCAENLDARFSDACDQLGVTPVSEPDRSYWGKAIGAIVATARGERHWLKVYGVTQIDNANRCTEIRADELIGSWKPSLIAQFDWSIENVHYTARLTTLANAPVERNPWAGAAAAELPDSWIHDLRAALNSLSTHASNGTFLRQKTLEDWLFARHHIRHEFPQGDWRLSHNDLNWGNVTAPALSILDWEWHGYSPVGYDIGRLIAFACRQSDLVARLEQAFAPDLTSFTGRVARSNATGWVMEGVRSGSFDPDLEPFLARMITRLDDELFDNRPRV